MNEIDNLTPWLKTNWSQLASYINQNRIPQALLITGKKGLGKGYLAKYFVQSLLCSSAPADGEFCEECQSCKLFKAETHPDYLVIEPEETGKSITISVIRQLISKLALKPQFDSYRVVIIHPADKLNNASANAFLKYLEEPTERTCLILITDKPAKLSATIRSRCQLMHIPVPDEKMICDWLKREGVAENSNLLLKLAQGAPLLAKEYAKASVLELRNEWFNNWLKFTQSELGFVTLAEQWNKLESEESELILLWLISWVTDMIKLANHNEAISLCNLDLIAHLLELLELLDLEDLFEYYDFLLLCQQRLVLSVNKQLMFEEILIQWSMLNKR